MHCYWLWRFCLKSTGLLLLLCFSFWSKDGGLSSGFLCRKWFVMFQLALAARNWQLLAAGYQRKEETCFFYAQSTMTVTSGRRGISLREIRVQELCESRGGRPGLFVLMSLTVSVDVKQHRAMLRLGHSLSLICQPTSEDMKLYIIIIIASELRGCVKVELAILGP